MLFYKYLKECGNAKYKKIVIIEIDSGLKNESIGYFMFSYSYFWSDSSNGRE